MVILAGAALWLAICVCFAVSAAIVGMPPQTIAHTIAVVTFNFGAVVGAVGLALLLRTQARHRAEHMHEALPRGPTR
jgi:hypothetical protein